MSPNRRQFLQALSVATAVPSAAGALPVDESQIPLWPGFDNLVKQHAKGALSGRRRVMLVGDSLHANLIPVGPIGGFYQADATYSAARPLKVVEHASGIISSVWPDIVDTLMGTNMASMPVTLPNDEEWGGDGSAFRNLLYNWLTGVKAWTPRSLVNTIPPWTPSYWQFKPGWLAINQIIRETASATNTKLLDLHGAFAGPDEFVKPDLVQDFVHPSRAGVDLMVSLKTAAYAELVAQYPL